MTDLTALRFHDEENAREWIEASRWPDVTTCPHCGSFNVMRMAGKTQAGMFLCRDCRDKFTCRTGTVMERSHIPLHKWLLALHLMASSKKGMSAHQLWRMLGFGSYRTAWFMCHRIREAMTPANPSSIGGESKVVESDETFIGGKARNRAYAKKEPKKHAVMTLVERDGESRSFHVANVKAKTLREKIVTTVSRKSHLMTDELASYEKVGNEFANHSGVCHSADEYVRLSGFVHVNTAECRFSLMKRAVYGTHHSISEAHLPRYLSEWDYKWNTREMTDSERAACAPKGAEGKRLQYRQPREAAHA